MNTNNVILAYKKFLELKRRPDMIKMANDLDIMSRNVLTYVDIFKSNPQQLTEVKITDVQQLYKELKEKYDDILLNTCFTGIIDEYPELVKLFINSPHDLRIDMIELALNEKSKMLNGKKETACVRDGLAFTEKKLGLPKGFYNKDDRTIEEFLANMRDSKN